MKHEIIQLDQVSEKGYIEFFLKSYTNSATLYTQLYIVTYILGTVNIF